MDITRQALQVISITYYNDLIESYEEKNLPRVKQVGDKLSDLIDDMDLVLTTNEYFLLGRWLNSAKRMAKITGGISHLEFNARIQITTWGPRENIEDYANKMWSGLLRDLYKSRWQAFVGYLTDSLSRGTPFDQKGFNVNMLVMESSWFARQDDYNEHPQGNTLATVLAIHQKYR